MSLRLVSSSASRPSMGLWRLHPGHAMSLHPRRASQLRIHRGAVWVTLGIPGAGSPASSGDHFLREGDTLEVPAGARLVMEPLSAVPGDQPVCFDWWPPMVSALPAGRFDREVQAPMREAVVALGQAAWALLRGVRGLLAYSEFLVTGRGRMLSPLESWRS